MSERTHAPRSGGRAAEQGTTGRGRDADTRRSDARGARHFTGDGDAHVDTRRSGIGRDGAGKPATRRDDRAAERVRDTEGVREPRRASAPESAPAEGRRAGASLGKGRRSEPALGRGRRSEPALAWRPGMPRQL